MIKRQRPLAVVAETEPARHEIVDGLLRQHVQRIGESFLEIARLADEVAQHAYYAKYDYLSVDDYMEDRFGIRPRTLARYRSVLDALAALPEGQIQEARVALTGVGIHKAAILAPVLQTEEAGRWQKWVSFAESATEDALQEKVSRALGAKPRGLLGERGSRFYKTLLRFVPEDAKAEVETVFALGQRRINPQQPQTVNPVEVFLCMVREVAVEWQR